MSLSTTNFSFFERLMFVFQGIVYFNHVGLWHGTISESHRFTQFIFSRSGNYFELGYGKLT